MKKIILGGLAILLPVSAVATIPVGRGEISLGASATASYDSNLSGRRNADEDYYGTFAPRMSYVRRAGKIEADANLSLSIQRYMDHTEFDSENVSADVSIRLSEKSFQNLSGALTVSYVESYNVDIDLNNRIKGASTNVSAQFGITTGPRTSFSLNGSYFNADRVGASDQETLSGGASFNYTLDDNMLSFTYGYTEATSTGINLLGADIDQKSNSFSVGLTRALYRDVKGRISYGYRILDRSAAETSGRVTSDKGSFITASIDGPFLPRRMFPKIQSHASISYEDAQTPGVNDVGGKQVAGDVGLTWTARPNTSVSLTATRSQRLSSSDLTVVSSRMHAHIDQQLRHNLSGSVGAGYSWESYRGVARKDGVLSLDTGLSYSFAHSWTSSASYTYTANSSNLAISDFVRHVASLTIGYTF